MSTTSLNGHILEKMLKNGLNNIRKHESEVNDMNVFPVPDGDTGTNMRLTLQNGIANAPSDKDLGAYLKMVKKGMLLGARGNSGVILSQLFTGLSQSLERDSIVNVREFCDALVEAYKTAYKSVIRPVEGTVLTVAREGIENIKGQINRGVTFEMILSLYIAEMRKSLKWTPELLPVLKEAGVLDSGATGYIYIFEGMLAALYGEEITADSETKQIEDESAATVNLNTSSFSADSKFEFGYCTEFLLQLLKDRKYQQNFNLDDFIKEISPLGDSLVALQDEDRVKVHIHTLKPSPVIELAQRYGEFVSFKLENMQLQHNEHIVNLEKKQAVAEHKSFAVVAVANGEGIKDLYKSMGCDIVLDGGPTMNTPAEEFYKAYESLNADLIAVLPNNKNIFQSAKQAIELSGRDNIKMLETQNLAEGYYALAMANVESTDAEYRFSLMQEGVDGVDVVSVTIASRDYSQGTVTCKKDDFIALLNGELIAASDSLKSLMDVVVKQIPDIDEKESCVIFAGADADDDLQSALEDALSDVVPHIETAFIDGGQKIFHFVIGF